MYSILLPLEVKLSRWEDVDPINRFNPATLLCLFQADGICRGLFSVQWVKVVVPFVDISGIVDHYGLNFLSVIYIELMFLGRQSYDFT